MTYTKLYKAYVLIDPITNKPQLIKACCEGKRKYYKDSIWKFARLSINPSNSENEPLWSTQS